MTSVEELKRMVPLENYFRQRGSTQDPNGRWRCPLPQNHKNGDANPSVTIKDNRARCWSADCFGEHGADIFSIVGTIESLPNFNDQKRRVEELAGLTNDTKPKLGKIVATYDFTDEHGTLLFQECRFDPKDFRLRRPDGAGGWSWGLGDARRVLYRLPELLQHLDRPVVVHEGPGCVDAAIRAGLAGLHTSTCGGANSPRKTDFSAVAHRDVVILPDHDEAGEKYLCDVTDMSRKAGAKSVKVLRLPDLPPKGDIKDWLNAGGTPEQFEKLCTDAPLYTIPQAEAETTDKPELNCDEGDLDELTKRAWKILHDENNPPALFKRGSGLVRVEEDGRGAVLAELTEAKTRYEVARLARCRRTKASMFGMGKREDCKPPTDLIKNLLATPANRIPLPELLGVIEVPVISGLGRIVQVPGYDAESQLFYRPYDRTANISIPVKPTGDEMGVARSVLDELFADFPFASEADRTHALGLLVLPFVRQCIKGPAPMHAVEAPEAGTGKGLLVQVALSPAIGNNIGVIADARDDDEMRKRITARFLEGCPVTLLDNVVRPLNSGVLAAALTATQWEDRRLGKTESLRVPAQTIWVMTANNPAMSLELARRTVRIRLDPKIDRPWLRNGWRHPNLLGWAHEKRADLITAALTLVQAWLDAGEPAPKAQPLGSFEEWTRVVGGIVEHAGYKEFLGNCHELYEVADTDGATWRTFTEMWWATHSDRPVTAKDLFDIAMDLDGLNLGKSASERGQRTALGAQLRKRRDQVIGRYRIESAGIEHNAALWRLRQINKPATPPYVPSPSASSADELLFEEETC